MVPSFPTDLFVGPEGCSEGTAALRDHKISQTMKMMWERGRYHVGRVPISWLARDGERHCDLQLTRGTAISAAAGVVVWWNFQSSTR